MHDKIPVAVEMLGATIIGVGLLMWIPAVAFIWLGAVCIVYAWGMARRESDGNSDT